MALTITTIKKNVVGNQREIIAEIQFDSGYTTGGHAFTPRTLSADESTGSVFWRVDPVQSAPAGAASRLCVYDHTAKKLVLFTALGTEAAGSSDQSTIKFRVLCRFGGAI